MRTTNKNIEIIGISGKAGSGKDFIGRTVLRPAGYTQWAMAWPMKMLAVGLGASYDDVFTHKPPAVREMLQRVGTEEGWMKHGKLYWVLQADAWLRTIHEHTGIRKFYFIDIRFAHEAQWVRSWSGTLLRLEHGDREYPLKGTDAAEHSSEIALDHWHDWDLKIVNGSSMTPAVARQLLVSAGVLPSKTSEGQEQIELELATSVGHG